MLENFVAGLANWRSLGPPSLTQYIMSEQEIFFAAEKNKVNDELDSYKELAEFEKLEKTSISYQISERVAVIENQNMAEEDIVTNGVQASLYQTSFHTFR